MPTPRPNLNESLKFALQVLHRIPKSRPITAKEIHEQLEGENINRDIRSVQRMLQKLSEIYDGIDCNKTSRPYSYRVTPNLRSLSISEIEPTEALVLELCKSQLGNLIPAPLKPAVQSYFEEAGLVLHGRNQESKEREWIEKVAQLPATHQLLPAEVDSDVLSAVTQALFDNHKLTFQYQNRKGDRRDYWVEPLGLFERGPTVYMVAGDLDDLSNEKPTIKVFALHRFISANNSNVAFEFYPDFDLKKYLKGERYMYGSGDTFSITFETTESAGLHLTESKASEDQIVEETKNGYRFTATLPDSLETRNWLKSFGSELRLIKVQPVEKQLSIAE